MAKRFTDTDKWKKSWFRGLGSRLRDIRQFLLDDCDHAGIWEIDLENVKHFTGQDVSLDELQSAFRHRLIPVDDDKLFIPDFIEFQYGELSEESKPHISVIKRLKRLTLWEEFSKGMQTLKDKDKEKNKDKEKKISPKFDFVSVYRSYPLKKGKTKGLALCAAKIQTEDAFALFAKAVLKYRAEVEREKPEPRFIKHFDTFVNCYADYTDDDAGTSVVTHINQHRSTICGIAKE